MRLWQSKEVTRTAQILSRLSRFSLPGVSEEYFSFSEGTQRNHESGRSSNFSWGLSLNPSCYIRHTFRGICVRIWRRRWHNSCTGHERGESIPPGTITDFGIAKEHQMESTNGLKETTR